MDERQGLLIKAYKYAAVSLFFLFLLVFSKTDETGLILGSLMIVVFAVFSYINFRRSKLVDEDDYQHLPPANSTKNEEIKYYKRYLYAGIVALALLSFIIIVDLNDIESGTVGSVSIWAPIAFIYRQFGYWPAVLTCPIGGIVIVFLYLKKIGNMDREKND